MKTFATLLAKEITALFVSPIAYAVMAVFLLLMGYTFAASLFLSKTATLVQEFFQAAMLLLLIVPVITMRLLAEERRAGTLELLLTSPVREIEVVLAKFLASVAVIVTMLALTVTHPITLEIFGDPDWGPVYSGYLGLILLGAALTSVPVNGRAGPSGRTRLCPSRIASTHTSTHSSQMYTSGPVIN
jgi:gliding motility-associated transport system permease protein